MEENGKLLRFVYHKGELVYERGEKEQTSYHQGAGTEALNRAGKIYYYHKDEQLSTALITDETGTVSNCYRYDAFGNILDSVEQIENRIRYTGQQYDGITGQYYLRARYYNPAVGRFMQEDTYRGDGLNLYAYCANNPVTYYDPSGYAGKSSYVAADGGDGGEFGDYKFKEGIDEDLRGGKGTFEEALEKAFEKTGVPKDDFEVTKWAMDQDGEVYPAEWKGPKGAEVSVDTGHPIGSGAPTVDHVGWQSPGKRKSGGAARGHIFVDEVPYNRDNK